MCTEHCAKKDIMKREGLIQTVINQRVTAIGT